MKEAGRAIDKYQPLWGSWKVEELIGQGNGSEVYRVYKEEWGKRYISMVKLLGFSIGKNDIKEAQAIGIDESTMPEYFKSLVGSIQNEIELMYRLRGNSNIVTYEDHVIYEKKGCKGWDVLIRMEFLQPLVDVLETRELGKLDVAKLGIDICKALEACSSEDIVHRDIRDSSIFVSPKGEFKLGNFNMAKELTKSGRTASANFNPLYMAPELYKEQGYDFSVDVYSLGIVMYKLLNKGRLPFLPLPPSNISVQDTEKSIEDRMAGKELSLPVDAGEGLGAIILKACSYDKKDRYKSPYEFRQKLEKYLKIGSRTAKSESLPVAADPINAPIKNVNGAIQPAEEKGDAAVRSAYKEELERVAVIELAAAVNKMDKKRRLEERKLLKTVLIGAALMLLAFTAAFIGAYEVEPVEETARAAPAIAVRPSPTIMSVLTPPPTTGADGEKYYYKGLEYMGNRKYSQALQAFEEAGRLGYDSEKVSRQIEQVERKAELERLYSKAEEYYKRQNYEKAIKAFAELSEADAAYGSTSIYSSSYLKLAEYHNMSGVKCFNQGSLDEAVKEFETALRLLAEMKIKVKRYDELSYSQLKELCDGNIARMKEKKEKVQEHLKLADEYNKAGVEKYNEGSYAGAKYKFETALKHLQGIRQLVPNYKANGYDGLLQIYSENVKRAEARLK